MRTMSTHRLTFKRRSGGHYNGYGEWVEGHTTNVSTVGSLQPFMQGQKLGTAVKITDKGLDSDSIYLYYTLTKLRGTDTFSETDNDYIELEDGIYEVMQIGNYAIPTFRTKHYVYWLVKRPPNTKGESDD